MSNACPSSEWEQIRQWLALGSHSTPDEYTETYNGRIFPDYLSLSGKNSQRRHYRTSDNANNGSHPVAKGSTTQMVAVVDALTTVANLWLLGLSNVTVESGHGSPLSDQSDSVHTLSGGESFQGYSIGICAADIIYNDTDTRPVAFPLHYVANDPATANTDLSRGGNLTYPAIVHPEVSRADILNDWDSSSQFGLQWFNLPQPQFNGTSLGAVILPPRLGNFSESHTWPQDIILCNLGAGWGTTTLQMHSSESPTGSSVSSRTSITNDGGVPVKSDQFTNPTTEQSHDKFNWNIGEYPEKPINMTRDWARHLNPSISSTNRSVFDLIMQENAIVQGPHELSFTTGSTTSILVMMIANGLGRISFNSTLHGSIKSKASSDGKSWIDADYWLSGKGNVFEPQRPDWVKLQVISHLQGYAYNTEASSSRLAIAVLTAYCIIALAHTLYAGSTGKPLHVIHVINSSPSHIPCSL